eukprot:scaffold55811_cov15-Phaeocystis_antarctica.AAC.1
MAACNRVSLRLHPSVRVSTKTAPSHLRLQSNLVRSQMSFAAASSSALALAAAASSSACRVRARARARARMRAKGWG